MSSAPAQARWGRGWALAAALAGLALLWGQAGSAAEVVHEVARGESLWGIARAKGVTVDALRARNELEGDAIRPGQRLVIPPKGWKAPQGKAGAGADRVQPASGVQTEASRGVFAKPPSWTQVQKSPEQRGGVNPCLTKDPGFGIYDSWQRGITMGQMISPGRGGVAKSGAFDLMIHFHGHEPVRKEWVRVMDGAVLVGIDLGLGSGAYFNAFASPSTFEQLIQSVELAVAKKTGRTNAHVRRVGLSAWSAGYGAVQQIISQSMGRRLVDSVILLDGLHCGYQGAKLDGRSIQPFIAWAQLAARREKFMFVSHSSIIPPGYSSTTETAALLVHEVGGRLKLAPSRRRGPMGLEAVSRYSRGSFHVRGFSGNGPMDHCAQIGLYRDVLKVHIKPRWRSPSGTQRRGPPAELRRIAASSPARKATSGAVSQPRAPQPPAPPVPPAVPVPEPKTSVSGTSAEPVPAAPELAASSTGG